MEIYLIMWTPDHLHQSNKESLHEKPHIPAQTYSCLWWEHGILTNTQVILVTSETWQQVT